MNIQLKNFLLAIAISSVLLGCAASSPVPTQSEYLRTTVGAFNISLSTRQANYVMRFEVVQNVEANMPLRIEFENPLDSSNPLVVDSMLSPGQAVLEVDSPPLPAIKDGATYQVVVIGLESVSNIEVFRHIQDVQFIAPPGI